MKKVSYTVYINGVPYSAKVEKQEDGTYVAASQGLYGFGDTPMEACDDITNPIKINNTKS